MNILDQFPKAAVSAEAEAKMTPENRAVAFMNAAVRYAGTCCQHEIPNDELVSLCYDVLVKVGKRFSPNRGRFFAFCKPRIRGALFRYWKTTAAVVRNAVGTESLGVTLSEGGHEDALPENVDEPGAIDSAHMALRERRREVADLAARQCNDRELTILQMIYTHHFTFDRVGKLHSISRAAAQAAAAKVILRLKRSVSR